MIIVRPINCRTQLHN